MNCIFKDICSYYESDGSCETLYSDLGKDWKKCYKNHTCVTQHFNESTVASSFIKGLLNHYALPTFNTIRPDDYLVVGTKYLYGDSVIKITKSGYLGKDCMYDVVGTQPFGEHFVRTSEVFKASGQLYDEQTHRRLGDFLRCYRDIKGINLMSMYNCYASQQNQNFYINRTKGVKAMLNKLYKVYQVPIKLNRTYTIALDCDASVAISPAFIQNNKLLQVSNGETTVDITNILFERGCSHFAIGSDFKKPITMNIDTSYLWDNTWDSYYTKYYAALNSSSADLAAFWAGLTKDETAGFNTFLANIKTQKILSEHEKYLYLLIQVPLNCKSSLVVLEGDFRRPTRYIKVEPGTLPTPFLTFDPLTYFTEQGVSSITFEDQRSVAEANRRYIKYGDGNNLLMCTYTHTIYASNPTEWHPEYFEVVTNSPITAITKCVDNSDFYEFTDRELDSLFFGDLFLLQMNDRVQHPFSNNLLAYLLHNCIDSEDIIANNVRKIENTFIGTKYSMGDKSTGIWSQKLRHNLFVTSLENADARGLDALGYVDKKLESYLESQNENIIW